MRDTRPYHAGTTLPYRDGDAPTPPATADLFNRFGAPDDMADAGDLDNVDRVELVRALVDSFARDCYHAEELTTIAGDLIGDILHMVTMEGGDPEAAHGAGWNHFQCEVGLGYGNGESYVVVIGGDEGEEPAEKTIVGRVPTYAAGLAWLHENGEVGFVNPASDPFHDEADADTEETR